ncbi:hypothetical protein FB446DRAFT_212125 [Lentinula raphanica]|nr:hypothetical protein FB446DRAFT_212125 [Lentinula raphanica]
MLVHRNFVSSSRTFPLHQLFLLGLFVMVGKVAVQAFPIETVASSSTSPPPALPASAVESNVRRPGKAPALELQGAAESEILLGYTSVATGTGEQFKKEAKGKSKPVENQKPIWERSLKPVKKGVLSNLKSKFKSGSKGSNQLPYDVRK